MAEEERRFFRLAHSAGYTKGNDLLPFPGGRRLEWGIPAATAFKNLQAFPAFARSPSPATCSFHRGYGAQCAAAVRYQYATDYPASRYAKNRPIREGFRFSPLLIAIFLA